MILDLLKNNFPQYKINDSSNRNIGQIQKITEICIDCPNIIVYLKRNEINDLYFKFIEMVEKSSGVLDSVPIDTIIINKDNYVYIRKNETNPIKILRCVNKNLLSNDSCCICMGHKSDNLKLINCNECQTPICKICLSKINNLNCPCCKNQLKIINLVCKL
jgi:hypothetical protein